MEFAKLELDQLRFFLDGESALVHTIYEILCCNLLQIVVRDTTPGSRAPAVTLPASALRPVGFEEDEGMLPYPRRSFVGYRLLQEYFTFPGQVLLRGPDRSAPGLRSRIQAQHRADLSVLALRGRRTPPASGNRHRAVHLPPGMQPGGEPLPADRRAHPARSAEVRISRGSGRAAAPGHGSFLGGPGGQPESAAAGDRSNISRSIRSAIPRSASSSRRSGSPTGALRCGRTTTAPKWIWRWWTCRSSPPARPPTR